MCYTNLAQCRQALAECGGDGTGGGQGGDLDVPLVVVGAVWGGLELVRTIWRMRAPQSWGEWPLDR